MDNNELTDMLQVFFECNKNRLEAVRRYSVRFPDREIPDSKIFQRIETNLRNYGSFKKPNTQKRKFSEDKELNVLLAVQENSQTSTREIAHNIGVSKTTVHGILRKHKFKPYVARKVHALEQNDPGRRIQFCRFYLNALEQDPNFYRMIIWSDECTFSNNGDDYEYGKQRVWGTIGFGLAAAISGFAVEHWSGNAISYRPAIICMYLEDLALITHTSNVKLLEGLIVAAETLGGEVVFFYISGLILERFGHVRTFSMCFLFYALRLGLISIVPSPWWLLLTEFLLQGPTYALTYATIVAYANDIAPPGMSATMQGLAAGMDDGFGYALGSFLGGVLYKYVGGQATYQIFTAFALICSVSHVVIHMKFLGDEFEDDMDDKYGAYELPVETTEIPRPTVETIPEEDEEHGERGIMLQRLAN
ncbi:hypothetical protein MML48_7g00004136 [Holotrichia oblita]|uniref:Uncharacterized protein n=1 Tax=Holotrichia oblita TaxID=644536 RepID=A0ACB9SRY4_HOLOL|nr:hypothetical protein MML48_7g00004136 [Holotrichia oblita]